MADSLHVRGRKLAGAALAGLIAAIVAEPVRAQEAEQASGLQDIVVTAQRRAENLQDVPIAITAITARTLTESGISTSDLIPQIAPSVQFARSGPSGLFFVRGVGTTNGSVGEEGANAVYVDDVYMADLGQAVTFFNNIDRIEVLKGPQGTLFGRNASGGLIHAVTREPGDELLVRGQIGYGNYQTLTGQFYAGGPVTDKIGLDIALTGQNQNKSWGRNLTTGRGNAKQDFYGIRSKLVARPSDTVKLTLAGDYFRDEDSTTLAFDLEPGQIGAGGITYVPGRDNRSNLAPHTSRKIGGVSLKGEVEFDFASLTSITAYRSNTTKSLIDIDGGPLPLINIDLVSGSKSFQQELRLASTETEPFSWQVGVFYLNLKATNYQNQSGGAFAGFGLRGFLIDAAQKTHSYAAFGELSYAITPTTRITGGLRYTQDKRTFSGGRAPVLLSGAVGAQVTQPDPDLKYNELTYRIALRQEVTPDLSFYASYNHGFKAGQFSLQAPVDPPVNPQYIDAYEIGMKSELFDRRLRLNVAVYRYDIDDFQSRSGGNLLNAAKVKVEGIDLDFEAAVTDSLRFFGGANILRSKFQRFGGPGEPLQAPINYPNFSPIATTCRPAALGLRDPGILGSGTPGGLVTCLGDVSGNYTASAPKFAGSLGASYIRELGDESQIRLTALYNYNSGYAFEPDNKFVQDSYSLLNASVEYRINRHLAVELWGKNIGSTTYSVQKLTSATGTTVILAAPRTYGVNLRFDY
jgi:iron complex outermembrane recepter protein